MLFTGLRTQFLKSTGFRSAGFFTSEEAENKGAEPKIEWLEASYRKDVNAWQVTQHTKQSAPTEEDLGESSMITANALTLSDAVKAINDFEESFSDPALYGRWEQDRTVQDAEAILNDQKYSLRHKIMNIGLPKL